MKKRSISFLLALLAVAMLLCVTPLAAAGAEDGEMTDSKTVILEYTGEPIDVSALFDTQPDGAIYTVSNYEPADHQLEGAMMTVTTPGSFRVVQTVGDTEVWISLGVYYTLTVTAKDQVLSAGALLSSTLSDIGEIVGLQEGHTVTAVTLASALGNGVGAHDVVKVQAVTVMNGDVDVSSYYNVASVDGKLHIYSTEWAIDDESHFYVCGVMDCNVISSKAAHSFENACDASCDVCQAAREVPDHTWTADSIVLREATETQEGERAYVCLVCGKMRVEEIPKLEHTPVFLIVCVVVACAIAGGCVAYFVVRNVKKKAAVAAAPTEEKPEETADTTEEKPEE